MLPRMFYGKKENAVPVGGNDCESEDEYLGENNSDEEFVVLEDCAGTLSKCEAGELLRYIIFENYVAF